MMLRFLVCSSILCLVWATSDNFPQCEVKVTCSECIQTTGCAWCSDENMLDNSRCFRPDVNLPYISDVCNEEYVYFPASSIEAEEKKVLQPKRLLPEKYNLNLRIDDPIYLTIRINRTLEDLNNLPRLELRHTASNFFSVDFKCLNNATLPISECDVIDGVQYINVKITAVKCSKYEKQLKQSFTVYASGMDDVVHIKTELLCSCSCEKEGSPGYVSKSRFCNAVGTLKCGVCHCNPGYFGNHCECNMMYPFEISTCTPPGSNNSLVCSGRGTCICGMCECEQRPLKDEVYSGKWCECDNFSCPRYNGQLCSGNGVCECGKCLCKSQWAGDACECSNSVESCMLKGNSTICSGRGDCICGKCRCHNKQDKGKFCEKCANCENRCEELQPCVLCQAYKKGPYSETDCLEKCQPSVILVDNVEDGLDEDSTLCEAEYNATCKYKFVYKPTTDAFIIKATTKTQC
ncbi:hypothetical protein FQR65_LT06459 [Abscondita terminalis]|nr:hypothetical protein FQR65_LT06459 [Abscondita terminalis]